MRNASYNPIDVADGTGTKTSPWIPANQLFAFSASAKAGGTLAGTLKIQVSNDPVTTPQASIAGDDLTGASVALAAGAHGLIAANTSAYNWVRLVWTASAGAGSFVSKFVGCGF